MEKGYILYIFFSYTKYVLWVYNNALYYMVQATSGEIMCSDWPIPETIDPYFLIISQSRLWEHTQLIRSHLDLFVYTEFVL